MSKNDIIILTGSYARGTNTEHSDIDLMCITENANKLYTETTFHDGKELQIIFVPRLKIHRMILSNTSSAMSVIVSMLKSSIIISDFHGYGKRLCRFADKYNVLPSESTASSMINILHSRCDELKHATDKLESQLLEADILVLLSHLMLFNFTASSKFCIRKLCKSKYHDEILTIHEKFIKNDDCSPLLEYVHNKIDVFWQEYYSTGHSLNNLPQAAEVMIYFPKAHIINNIMLSKILNKLTEILPNCELYAFYHDSMQVMNEGTYCCISSRTTSSSEICHIIRSYDLTIVMDRMESQLEMIFPYYSNFISGYAFGGKKIYDSLLHHFSEVFEQVLKYSCTQEVEPFIYSSSVYTVGKLSLLYEELYGNKDNFIINLATMLLPDAMDPNGHYNASQTEYLKIAALHYFSKKYNESSGRQEKNISDILKENVDELQKINLSINNLCEHIKGIDMREVNYPDIYPFEKKEDILFVEIALHILSVLQLKGEEKFAIIYDVSKYFGLCLENFLLQDKQI